MTRRMPTAGPEKNPADDRETFYRCKECGQQVDARVDSDVYFHAQEGHRPLLASQK